MYCPVCHEDCEESGEDMTQTVCGHYFHHRCIAEWINKYELCAVCEHPIDKSSYPLPEPEQTPAVLGGGITNVIPSAYTSEVLNNIWFRVKLSDLHEK